LDRLRVGGPLPVGELFEKRVDLTDGVRTTATVERVVDTGSYQRVRSGRGDQVVFITFRLTDERGAEVVCQCRLLIYSSHIPAPGTIVAVAYLPGRSSETLDLVRSEKGVPLMDLWEPPNPDVPRGWSGGVFEVAPLGPEGTFPLRGHGIEEDRELFRSGRQAEAELIRSQDEKRTGTSEALKRTLTVRVEGREIDVVAWTPLSIWPEPGDLIKVAVSADGSKVALDTDERWDGHPGRALIFTRPPNAIPPEIRRDLAALEQAKDSGKLPESVFEQMKGNMLAAAQPASEQPPSGKRSEP
jgi:hypothetical protein